jgi:hypothetical protein
VRYAKNTRRGTSGLAHPFNSDLPKAKVPKTGKTTRDMSQVTDGPDIEATITLAMTGTEEKAPGKTGGTRSKTGKTGETKTPDRKTH